MKNKNTLTGYQYIRDCLLWGMLSMGWYRVYIMKCIKYYTNPQSGFILTVLAGLSVFLCGLFVFYEHWSKWAVFVTLVLPYGIYTAIAYYAYFGFLIELVLIIATLFSIGFLVYMLFKKIKNPTKKKQIIKRRLFCCLRRSASIYAIGMAVIILTVFRNTAISPIVNDTDVAVLGFSGQEYRIENNKEAIMKLHPETWSDLTVEEKLEVLEVIANMEAYYLGLATKLNVEADDLPKPNVEADDIPKSVEGKYNELTHTICFNLSYLENKEVFSVVRTCCHEAYHAYEFGLINLYNSTDRSFQSLRLFKKAILYKEEFENYNDGDADFFSYHSQITERDAREYAEAEARYYEFRMWEYRREADGE